MNGRKPARSRLIRSFQVMASRSAFGSGGPRCGCNWQRMAM
jgi:hypothetical protein